MVLRQNCSGVSFISCCPLYGASSPGGKMPPFSCVGGVGGPSLVCGGLALALALFTGIVLRVFTGGVLDFNPCSISVRAVFRCFVP